MKEIQSKIGLQKFVIAEAMRRGCIEHPDDNEEARQYFPVFLSAPAETIGRQRVGPDRGMCFGAVTYKPTSGL